MAEGIVRDLELQIIKKDSTSNDPEVSTNTPVRLVVENRTADVWTFLWENQETSFENVGLSATELAEMGTLLEEFTQQHVRYRIDTNAIWLGLVNPDEVREMAIGLLDTLTAVAPAEAQEAFAPLYDLYENMSEEALATTFAEEPQLLHALEAVELAVGEIVEYDDYLPNAFGGRAFPAITTLRVAELVDDQGCVVIESLTLPDPEIFGEIMAESLQDSFGTAEDAAAEIEELFASFEIENRIIAQFDLETGFFREITASQRIGDDSFEVVESKIITDITTD